MTSEPARHDKSGMAIVKPVHICRIAAARLLVEKRPDHSANSAYVHDARNTEVEIARLFGDRFTCGTVQERNTLRYGTRYKGKNIKHALMPPFLVLCGSLSGS